MIIIKEIIHAIVANLNAKGKRLKKNKLLCTKNVMYCYLDTITYKIFFVMKKLVSQEFKIGLVTVICGVILFVGIDYLKGINIFKPNNYYYVKYKNVSGLAVSSPITIDGFNVGLVRSIEYDYKDPGNVIVEISLAKQLKVPAGSKAILSTDLLGSASIELKLNHYVSSTHSVADTLIGENNAGLMGSVEIGRASCRERVSSPV